MSAAEAGHDERSGLLARQWRDYADCHRDRLNLWLHFFMVPVFIGGALGTAVNVWHGRWAGATIAALVAVAALALQAAGRRRELRAQPSYRGPGDYVLRTLAEQFITFPRYVLGGGWLRAVTRHQPRRP